MRTLLILSLLTTFTSFAQKKVDTLFVADKKIALIKEKIIFPSQSGPVMLPSEYKEVEDFHNGRKIEYLRESDSTETTFQNNDGNEIAVKIGQKSCDSSGYNYLTLYAFTDSIFISHKDLRNLRPYIKSGVKKYYFNAARLRKIKNGILHKYSCTRTDSGYLLRFINIDESVNQNGNNNKTIYILDNFYYMRGNSTYILDREFIIKVK